MKLRQDIAFYAKHVLNAGGYVAGQIELTWKCFQHCAFCDSWREREADRLEDEWSLNALRKFFADLRRSFPAFEHLSFTGGDPQAWEPFDEFLRWWLDWSDGAISLQVNTALARPIADEQLWREALADVRVSFDASDPMTYRQRRGDNENLPRDILDRMESLRHPRLATITTVGDDNIHNMPAIICSLRDLAEKGVPLRKAMFLPVLGPRAEFLEGFWDAWNEVRALSDMFSVPTSFAEDPGEVLDEIERNLNVRCWTERMSFHIKPNGDLYPCCLIGGEALPTKKNYHYGNVKRGPGAFAKIYEDQCEGREPPARYGDCDCGCRTMCQFKQFQMNLACETALRVRLSMP